MRRFIKGFTLIELLVVVALIALLMTVMVPVVLRFMSGRGLGMAGNNIAGFVAYARTEAMNTRQTHVLVMYPEEEAAPGQEGSTITLRIGPGMALYRINLNPTGNDEVVNFVKELSFNTQLGGDIRFGDRWLRRTPKGPLQELPQRANELFTGKYKLVLRPDGRILVPDDRPGYVLDQESTRNLDTDIIMTDDARYLFIDINAATGAVRRSPALFKEDVGDQ